MAEGKDTEFEWLKVTSSACDLLTPTSKGVYDQYVHDSDDKLLIDGFFRENVQNRVLPPGVNRVIAAYYSKVYSMREMRRKLRNVSYIGTYLMSETSLLFSRIGNSCTDEPVMSLSDDFRQWREGRRERGGR